MAINREYTRGGMWSDPSFWQTAIFAAAILAAVVSCFVNN